MKRIFISYSHKDEKWKNRLVTHLKVLQIEGHLDIWDDRQIQAGEDWYDRIKTALSNVDAAILLISADFLTSAFILKEEIPVLLQRKVKEGVKIFPLIVRPCPWTEVKWLSMIQVRPKDGKPMSGFKEHKIDSILSDFSIEIKDILEKSEKPKITAAIDAVEKGPEKIYLSKLPTTGSILLGREKELEILDKAWEDESICILTLVAWGGIGKTAMVNEWLNRLHKDNYRCADRVYGWSFYSQGTSEDRQTSADDFVDDALRWFGDPDPIQGSPWDKGKRLAGLIREKKTLLILDGLEPLQYPPGEMQGHLKDQALQALLKELARSNPGLCLVTTRVKVEDIEHAVDRSVKRICLEHLPPGVGAELLKKLGVNGTTSELRNASKEFKGHALALNLLGRYLAVVHEGDIRKKDLIPMLTEEEKEGGHARRVMESYEKFLSGKPELNILFIMGLFDRPAEGGAIEALREKPPIDGLTTELQNLTDTQWQYALKHLCDLNLLAEEVAQRHDTLDCHPLLREYFGEKLQKNNLEAWEEAHSRLYEYYKNIPDKEYPDTFKEMEPLYGAVTHGCLAGRYQESLEEIYFKRIHRGNKAYSAKKLGAFGSDLVALSSFFEIPWSHPASGLTEENKSFIYSEASFNLWAVGRLLEALPPMHAGLKARITQGQWKNAAIIASNLSELYLTLGNVIKAKEVAQHGVEFADRSGDASWQSALRATLAYTLHQAGEVPNAEILYREAETIQQNWLPQYPFLFALRGFWYCNLFLEKEQFQEVLKRCIQTLKWVEKAGLDLLSPALEKLSLGRAHWLKTLNEHSMDFTIAWDYLNQSLEGLRKYGSQHYLPFGLLARSAVYRKMKEFSIAWEDIEEAREIAEQGSMGLHLADYHLEAAWLCIEEWKSGIEGKKEEAQTYLATAKELINKIGYHRRDKEVNELEEKLS